MSVTALTDFTKAQLRRILAFPKRVIDNFIAHLDSVETQLNRVTGATQVHRVPLQDMKLPASLLQVAATASAGILGLVSGTHGSASPYLVGVGANNNTKTDSTRFMWQLPASYQAGAAVTLRVKAKLSAAAAAACSIDALVYESDLNLGVSSDLCATAAQSLTTTITNFDFTITPTDLAPGDTLDVLLTTVVNDTGGSGTITSIITNVEFRLGAIDTV